MADISCGLTDLSCQWQWVQDEIKGFFVWISEQIFNGLLGVLNAIDGMLPSWTHNVGSLHLPSEVAWFANAFELPAGAAIVGSAYTIRFILRRIPLIG